MTTDTPPHILIVNSPYYAEINEELTAGTIEALDSAGASYEVVAIFGAFEAPAAIAMAAEARNSDGSSKYDGFIALGCVVRGETTHYDYVCGESARGLMDLSTSRKIAIGYGILTVENRDQAWDRAARDKKNKGRDAAEACLRMIGLRHQFGLTGQ